MTVIWPGHPFPLGASYDGAGTNFAVFSNAADSVELCLFDDGVEQRIELTERSAYVHHGYVPGIGPGQHYGYRVHGPWDPSRGQRANPHKVLLDPYSKAIEGAVTWGQSVYAHHLDDPQRADTTDSADATPRSVVVNPFFDWGHDRPPRTPLHQSIIYETHVRGLTMTHPDVIPEHRGTYAGLGSEPIIRYLTGLGVTAVELLPVHHMSPERFLVDRGLTNYWGYSSVGFFAPEARYASNAKRGRQVQEFRQMVKDLHQAGIEVILDVVYNHTAEGSELGPTFCFRGLDNAAYYRLDPSDLSRYVDYTGCGNSLNMLHPHVLQLIMDSLRYWISEMHVDGFRFDLAATLARELHDVDRLSAFFDIIQQDPVINRVKLIAEPWDLGEGGYQVGNFPPLWSEWNGKYRDEVRDYWRGADAMLGDFAFRLTGSSDLYGSSGRRPSASVNFITAHDGFTLADLVSYDHKHNDANLEDDRDGTTDNRSWNSGAEGVTTDPDVIDRRGRRARGLLTTLMLSQGVPMLLGGDELGRTQGGNNNAYCQDNEISWHDWESVDRDMLAFTRRLTTLRREHPVLHRREFFEGSIVRGDATHDIAWMTPSGDTMTAEDWQVGYARSLMVFLNGEVIPSPGLRGEQVLDDSFLVLSNANDEPMAFTVPSDLAAQGWELELDSAEPTAPAGAIETDQPVTVGGFSVVVLRSPRARSVRHC
jgi:isoamylase